MRPLAAAVIDALTEEGAKVQGVIDWLREQKALADDAPIGVGSRDGRTVLLASRDLAKGEVAFSIPESCWITTATVGKSVLGPHVKDQEGWLQLSLFLLHERGQAGGSPWAAYLSSLPSDPGTPLFWDEAQLALLQGTQLLATMEGYREFFDQRFAQLHDTLFQQQPELFPQDIFNAEAFRWAVCTVRSRVHAPLEREAIALVPLADMVSHASGEGCGSWALKSAGLFGGTQSLTWAASPQAGLKAGAVLTMDYAQQQQGSQPGGRGAAVAAGAGLGVKLDNQVLLDYGVLDPVTDVPGYVLSLSLPEGDLFYDDKADILELAGLGESANFTLKPDQAPDPEMLAFLRLMNANGADAFLLEALFRNEAWGHMLDPLSEENEAAMCTGMTDGCRAALRGYCSSIDQDLALLRGTDLGPDTREQMAVRVRLGEKEAIDAALRFFEGRSRQLQALEYYAERRLKRLGLLDDTGRTTYDSLFEDGIA